VSARLNRRGYDGSITVAAFKGAARRVGAKANASGTKGDPNVTIKPSTCNSLLWAAGHDGSAARDLTPASGQHLVNLLLDQKANDTFWTQALDAPVPNRDRVTLSVTGTDHDRWTMAAVEIPPARDDDAHGGQGAGAATTERDDSCAGPVAARRSSVVLGVAAGRGSGIIEHMFDPGSSSTELGSRAVPDGELDALAERARALASQIARLQAELVGVTARIDRLEATSGMTAAQWLAWQCGLTPSEARRSVRLARRCGELPALSLAFEAGRLSEGTVALLERVATPDNEARLLEIAEHATGAQLATLVRDFRQVVDTAPEPDAEPEPRDEVVSYGLDDAGRWRLRASLTLEAGAEIEQAFAVAFEQARADDDSPVTTADCLLRIAQSFVAGAGSPPRVLPERFLVQVRVDADGATLPGIGSIPIESAETILCASWVSVLTDRRGRPLTITSPTRCATPAQHRALVTRDRTCQFPGCGRTHYLHAHHLVFHADGGATHLDNLVLLCGHHHRLVHRHGWTLARRPDGALCMVDPAGVAVPPPGERPPPDIVPLDRFTRGNIIEHWLGDTG